MILENFFLAFCLIIGTERATIASAAHTNSAFNHHRSDSKNAGDHARLRMLATMDRPPKFLGHVPRAENPHGKRKAVKSTDDSFRPYAEDNKNAKSIATLRIKTFKDQPTQFLDEIPEPENRVAKKLKVKSPNDSFRAFDDTKKNAKSHAMVRMLATREPSTKFLDGIPKAENGVEKKANVKAFDYL